MKDSQLNNTASPVSLDNEMAKEKRNLGFDMAKGICIALMVVGHSGAPQFLHDAIYMFHMPCFFIISGWLFKEKYIDNVMSFIKRKITTLWKPYVTWGLIFLCLSNLFIWLNILKPPYLTKADFLHEGISILTMQHCGNLLGGFWFITSLFIGSIVSILWYKIVGNKPLQILIGIIVFLGLAFIFCHYSSSSAYRTYSILSTAYFMTGTLLSRLKIPEGKVRLIIIIIAMAVLSCGVLFITPKGIGWLSSKLIIPFFLSSTIISYSVIIVCTASVPHSFFKWLATLGRRSLDILIFHFLLFKGVSLIKIWHFNLPIERLSDFPIITDTNNMYWILYAAFGIWGSLMVSDIIGIVKKRSLKFFHNRLNASKKNSF